jgi:hypothetical protein
MLNLYIVSRSFPIGWDETRAILVVAQSEHMARQITPRVEDGWPSPEHLTVRKVGQADPGFQGGEILLVDFKNG